MQKEDLNIILVDTHDPMTIGFADVSDYGNTIIKNPSFEITPPAFSKVNVLFTTGSVNIFNASDLKLSCDYETGIPDGIYKVKYSISPNTQLFVEKSFMRTHGIICRLYKYILSLPQDKLSPIKLLIDGSISAANKGNCELSYELYKQASKILDRLDKCSC